VVAGAIPIDAKLLKAALARSAACATIEELGRLCDADHAGGGDARVAEHVAGCIRCRTELALLKQFETAAPRPDEEPAASWIAARLESDVGRMTSVAAPRSSRVVAAAEETGRRPLRDDDAGRFPQRAVWPVAAGLALAAATLLVVLNLPGREVRPPALPADPGAGPVVFRSNAVTLLSPAGDLDAPASELRWEAVPGAASYSVQVTEVDRTEVWKAETREPALSLPAAVRTRMVPGKPLFWQVVAKDATGKTVASSQVQRFRVRVGVRDPGQ
jgi:hypothetical protein